MIAATEVNKGVGNEKGIMGTLGSGTRAACTRWMRAHEAVIKGGSSGAALAGRKPDKTQEQGGGVVESGGEGGIGGSDDIGEGRASKGREVKVAIHGGGEVVGKDVEGGEGEANSGDQAAQLSRVRRGAGGGGGGKAEN